MVRFIDEHRDQYGVEPICTVLPIAPSVYHEHKLWQRKPEERSTRAKRDEELRARIQGAWESHFQVYGARRIWKHLVNDENVAVARCTVERLMRDLGLQGAGRGKCVKVTTCPNTGKVRRPDLVEREFTARRPDQLWVADQTCVETWRGFVYLAFIVDVFSRQIVGWRASNSQRSGLALDALEKALHERRVHGSERPTHHSDRCAQYLSIRYTERLREAGIERSVGSDGDSYHNSLAESVIGLFKTEVIHRHGSWKNYEDVECATFTWVAGYNGSRLHESLGWAVPILRTSGYDRIAVVMG